MTAENVLIDVLREIGISKSSPQLSGNDADVLLIRGFMNDSGKDIAFRTEWSRMSVEKTVAASVASEALQTDFHSLVEKGAVWIDKTPWEPIRVIVAPEMWEFVKGQPSSVRTYCHLQNGNINFSPTLDVNGAKYRYISNQWVDGKTEIDQNGDTIKFPERLLKLDTIIRWRRSKSLEYGDFQDEFDRAFNDEIKADRGIG